MSEQIVFQSWAGAIAAFAFIVSAVVITAMWIHVWRVPPERLRHLESLPFDPPASTASREETRP